VLAVIDTTTRRAVPITPEWREALAPWLVPDESAP
jgi:acyl-CoA thioesterase FadM